MDIKIAGPPVFTPNAPTGPGSNKAARDNVIGLSKAHGKESQAFKRSARRSTRKAKECGQQSHLLGQCLPEAITNCIISRLHLFAIKSIQKSRVNSNFSAPFNSNGLPSPRFNRGEFQHGSARRCPMGVTFGLNRAHRERWAFKRSLRKST